MQISTAIIQYRNAIYYGTHNHKKQRQGLGLLITDLSQIILARWQSNQIAGNYFYTNSDIYAYGSKYQGKFEGQNVFIDNQIAIYSMCHQNMFHGNVLIKYADIYQAYQFKNGQKIKDLAILKPADPFKQFFKNMKNSAQLFIQDFLSTQKNSCINKIQLDKFSYFGGTDEPKRFGQGLGFVLIGDKIFSAGNYNKSDLNGIGRLYLQNQIHDGVFKNGSLHGIGIKWSTKKQQFVHGIFKQKQLEVLSRGNKFPLEVIKNIKNEFHLRSFNFLNDWIIIEKLLQVEVKNIFKAESIVNNNKRDNLNELLKMHFSSKIYEQQIKRQKSEKNIGKQKNKKQKSPQKINYIQNIKIQGIDMDKHNHNYELTPIYKTNMYAQDKLISAIKQYKDLSNKKNKKKN